MSEWDQLDRLDSVRDQPPSDNDTGRQRLDEIEGEAARKWYAERQEELGKS